MGGGGTLRLLLFVFIFLSPLLKEIFAWSFANGSSLVICTYNVQQMATHGCYCNIS
jgi:hypothetical protein